MCPLLQKLAKYWVLGKLQHPQNNLERMSDMRLFTLTMCCLQQSFLFTNKLLKRTNKVVCESKLPSNIPPALHRVAMGSGTRRRSATHSLAQVQTAKNKFKLFFLGGLRPPRPRLQVGCCRSLRKPGANA